MTDGKPSSAAKLNDDERLELNELRKLFARLKRKQERRRKAKRRLLVGGVRVVRNFMVGTELTEAMLSWFEAMRRFQAKIRTEPPLPETAKVASAVIRRIVRVSLLRVAVALMLSLGGVITTGILVWQGLQVRSQVKEQQKQNQLIQSQAKQQNELIQSQVEQQRAQNKLIRDQFERQRRDQLLETIYTVVCSDPQNPSTCQPRANPRAVREAVLAFVKMERDKEVQPDLGRAILRKAELANTPLSEVMLVRADLGEANLQGADLKGAKLFEADLKGANLRWATLLGAILRGADLQGADLHGADLHGADLREVIDVTPEQLATACGDTRTQLPKGCEMPETWPCRFDESGERIQDGEG